MDYGKNSATPPLPTANDQTDKTENPNPMNDYPSVIKVCRWIVVLGLINFGIFLAGAFCLGGDAVNGKVTEGHYYVFGVRAKAGQKVYTEVSKSAFSYSKWHVYTLWITWPLVMAAVFLVNRYRKRLQN